MGLRPKLGFGRVQVPAHGFKSQTVVNGFSFTITENTSGSLHIVLCLSARRSNQSILKEISPEYSLEKLMLKLRLQYFGHLMRRTDSFEETLMLGRIEGRRKRGRQWM